MYEGYITCKKESRIIMKNSNNKINNTIVSLGKKEGKKEGFNLVNEKPVGFIYIKSYFTTIFPFLRGIL